MMYYFYSRSYNFVNCTISLAKIHSLFTCGSLLVNVPSKKADVDNSLTCVLTFSSARLRNIFFPVHKFDLLLSLSVVSHSLSQRSNSNLLLPEAKAQVQSTFVSHRSDLSIFAMKQD